MPRNHSDKIEPEVLAYLRAWHEDPQWTKAALKQYVLWGELSPRQVRALRDLSNDARHELLRKHGYAKKS